MVELARIGILRIGWGEVCSSSDCDEEEKMTGEN
jgi:hypothetical protein